MKGEAKMEEKKIYVLAEVEVLKFQQADIITESLDPSDIDSSGWI